MKVKKLIKSLLIIVLIVLILQPTRTYEIDSFDTMKSKADKFIDEGKKEGETLLSDNDLKNLVLPIARTLVAAATIIVTIVTMILGIKYMIANPDDKAKLKQKLVGLVISTIVIYGAQGIWALLYNFMTVVAH